MTEYATLVLYNEDVCTEQQRAHASRPGQITAFGSATVAAKPFIRANMLLRTVAEAFYKRSTSCAQNIGS